MRYRIYSSLLKQAQRKQKYNPSNELVMLFQIKMPVSWSKKKKDSLRGKPMQSRPDIDNLVKAILDSLFPDEDSMVWKGRNPLKSRVHFFKIN